MVLSELNNTLPNNNIRFYNGWHKFEFANGKWFVWSTQKFQIHTESRSIQMEFSSLIKNILYINNTEYNVLEGHNKIIVKDIRGIMDCSLKNVVVPSEMYPDKYDDNRPLGISLTKIDDLKDIKCEKQDLSYWIHGSGIGIFMSTQVGRDFSVPGVTINAIILSTNRDVNTKMATDAIVDTSLDFIYSENVLNCILDIKKAFIKWKQILKPNGIIYCIVPNLTSCNIDKYFYNSRSEISHTFSTTITRFNLQNKSHLHISDLLHIAKDIDLNFEYFFVCKSTNELHVILSNSEFKYKNIEEIDEIYPMVKQLFRPTFFEKSSNCLFLPPDLPFGHYVAGYLRFVNYYNSSNKIVCCKTGEEIFFPNATAFEYDWTYEDNFRNDIDYWKCGKYKDITIVNNYNHGFSDYTMEYLLALPLSFKVIPNFNYDIVISMRYKTYKDKLHIGWQGNYTQWDKIVYPLLERGYKIVNIGVCDESLKIDGVHNSWEFSNPNEFSISVLKGSKLFIGTDSGGSHLAGTVGITSILFRQYNSSVNCLPFIYNVNKKNTIIIEDGWNNPSEVLKASLKELM